MSAWVEKDITPPASTNYKIEDGQVIIPQTANGRKGIQPTVNFKVNGGKRADIKVGKKVTFTAEIEVPTNTGKIVSIEIDFFGTGAFFNFPKSVIKFSKNSKTATVKMKAVQSIKGTLFPTVRIASQRDGDTQTYFARIQNLDRVRVVVK